MKVCKPGRNPRPFNKEVLASVPAKIWRGKFFPYSSGSAVPEAYPLSDKSDLVSKDSLANIEGVCVRISCAPTSSENNCNQIGQNHNKVAEQTQFKSSGQNILEFHIEI